MARSKHQKPSESLIGAAEATRILRQSAVDAVAVIDSEDRALFWNVGAEKMFGYRRSDILGQPLHDKIVPERFRRKARKGRARFARDGTGAVIGTTTEVVALHCDGHEFPVELTVNAYRKDGRWRAFAIIRDVTARTEAFRLVTELSQFPDQNPEPVFRIQQPTGRIIYKNPAATAVRKSDWARLEELFASAAKAEGRAQFELPLNDGRVLLFDVQPVKRETYTNLYGRDITAQRQARKNIEKVLAQTVEAIGRTVEVRDPATAGHERRAAALADAIAAEMEISEKQREGIRLAATIHDIGIVRVPMDILKKPGRLSGAEIEIIRQHPRSGYDILEGIQFPWPIAQVVRQHHERPDGSGYPDGLKDEDILLEAKILGIADVVAAMTSHRPYRAALGIDAALVELLDHKGARYDSGIVDACVRVFGHQHFTFPPL